MDFAVVAGGVDDSGAQRPNNLWHITGVSATDNLTPGTNITLLPTAISFNDPFNNNNGDELDVFTDTIVIPAGDDVACFQAESPTGPTPQGASFVWNVGGFGLRDPEPLAVTLQSLTAVSPSNYILFTGFAGLLLLAVPTAVVIANRRRKK